MPGEETVRTEEADPFADKTIEDGLREAEGPEGETVAARDRLPDNPLTLVRTTLEVEEDPAGTDTDPGVAETVKSTT